MEVQFPTLDCQQLFFNEYCDFVNDYREIEQPKQMSKTIYYYKKEHDGSESVISITDDVYISAWYSFHAYGVSANVSFGDFNCLTAYDVKQSVINYYRTEYEVSDKETFDRVFQRASELKKAIDKIRDDFYDNPSSQESSITEEQWKEILKEVEEETNKIFEKIMK